MKMMDCLRSHLLVAVAFSALFGLLAVSGCGSDTVDLTPPDITFNGTTAKTTSPFHSLSGTVEAGATVTVTVGTQEFPATVSGSVWSHDVTLSPGLNVVSVRAADATGNSQTLSFVLTYDALTFEVYTTPVADSSQTIYGLVDPALQAGLTASLNGTAITPVVTDDTWMVSLPNLLDGDNAIVVRLTDPSLPNGFLEGTLTINVNAGASPLSFAAPGIVKTTVPSQVVTGTYESSPSGVFLSPFPNETLPLVDATGSWSATYPGLAIGKNAIVATATSLSGVVTSARSLIIVGQEPPLVRQVAPAQGTINVATSAVVTALFDVDMLGTTLDSPANNFTLTDTLGAPVSATVAYDSATRVVTLTPNAPLSAATLYTATLSTAITDAGGAPIAQPLSWNFTTAP